MLRELILPYQTVTLIGLCKNAGKTTTVCKILEECNSELIAITSVGRDGETTDVVTGTKKPEIFIKKGTLFATARGMISLCDVTIEVIDITPYRTPFGEIAIFRALSDGYVQIAGPSSVSQLELVSQIFIKEGATRIIIDGAASRKSLAGAGEDTCAILCVGASMDRNMEKTIMETVHICNLFNVVKFENQEIFDQIDACESKFELFDSNLKKIDFPQDEFGNPVFSQFSIEKNILWIEGAVTTKILTDLYKKGLSLKVITQDATHFLCDKKSTEQFLSKGGELFVKRKLNIVAISANPWSAYGSHYDKDEFIQTLQENVCIPVLNMREELS